MNNFYHQLKLIIKILKYTHHIKNSYGIFKIASNNHKYASQFSYENLKNDKDVVLATVIQDGRALKYVSEILQNDKEVVLAAVNQDGSALYYASEELQNDKDVVLAAVNQDGKALKYVSEILQDDKDVVLAAVIRYGYALYCASEELQNDLFLLNLLHNFFNLPKNNIKDKKNEQWLE